MKHAILTGSTALLLFACSEPDREPAAIPPADAPADETGGPDTGAPPRDPASDRTGDDPGDVRGIEAEYLVRPWAVKGGDCDRPHFDISRNSAGGTVVETRINGSPRTGYVQRGPDAYFIFDALRLPIEVRGVDGLAVRPAESGETVRLAGHAVEGDGVVFVQCPEEAG